MMLVVVAEFEVHFAKDVFMAAMSYLENGGNNRGQVSQVRGMGSTATI